jgi:hypothetical protein
MDTNLCGGGSDNHCSSSKSSVIAALDGKYSEVASITIRKKKIIQSAACGGIG